MRRIHVDFNRLTSAPVGLVKYPPEGGQPALAEHERVTLYDADGLEVEAIILPYMTARGERVWVASPDDETWRDTIPPTIPVSPGTTREVG